MEDVMTLKRQVILAGLVGVTLGVSYIPTPFVREAATMAATVVARQ
jgi:hypothetical protein